jgi:acetyltransferase-like isoleucine patch superfamily enzyme
VSADSAPRVHSTAIVEAEVELGAGTAIWDGVHVRSGARIGHSCIVGEKSYVAYDVRIGNLVKLNAHVYVCAGVTIEDGCLIAAHVVFTNDPAPRATDPEVRVLRPSSPGPETRRTVVRRGASIGANATIGPGIEIGTFAMVGMGAVVTRDVPPHGLVAGNPARLLGLVARNGSTVWRAQGGDHQLPEDGTAIPCPDGGRLVVTNGIPHWHG